MYILFPLFLTPLKYSTTENFYILMIIIGEMGIHQFCLMVILFWLSSPCLSVLLSAASELLLEILGFTVLAGEMINVFNLNYPFLQDALWGCRGGGRQ